jgi:hypothetical protein
VKQYVLLAVHTWRVLPVVSKRQKIYIGEMNKTGLGVILDRS